jgi:hypothetical protein
MNGHRLETEIDRYWRDAKAFVKARTTDPNDPPWFAFVRHSEARLRWELYFLWRLGTMPIGLKYQDDDKIKEFLVPCEWPDDFDSRYKPKTIGVRLAENARDMQVPLTEDLKRLAKAWLDRSDAKAQQLLSAAKQKKFTTKEQQAAEARSRLIHMIGEDAFDRLPNAET